MSPIKALIVDDSKSARFSLKKMLSQHDVEADVAESGREAIEILKNTDTPPDVIFMDHMMPDMDGFETTKAIVADPDIPDIPIIMCTSNEGDEYLTEAKDIGAQGVVSKPPTQNGLKKILDGLAVATEAEAAAPAAAVISNEQIAAITANVLQQTESRTRELISEFISKEAARVQDETMIAVNAQLQELREEILRESKKQTDGLIKAELEGHTGEIIKSGLEKFEQEVRKVKKSLLAEQDQFRSTVKSLAEKAAMDSVAGATEEARQIAQKAADEATQKAREAAAQVTAGVSSQARMLAAIAGAVGIIAAVAVYFLK